MFSIVKRIDAVSDRNRVCCFQFSNAYVFFFYFIRELSV